VFFSVFLKKTQKLAARSGQNGWFWWDSLFKAFLPDSGTVIAAQAA
jgi:hypothetical protein|tara:strand:- start:1809 stop:1946 length:138 start_codon:yes stop_codon:yes gene_type:complete